MSDNQTELRLQDEHELAGAPDNISLAVVIYDDRGGLPLGAGTALVCGVIATGFQLRVEVDSIFQMRLFIPRVQAMGEFVAPQMPTIGGATTRTELRGHSAVPRWSLLPSANAPTGIFASKADRRIPCSIYWYSPFRLSGGSHTLCVYGIRVLVNSQAAWDETLASCGKPGGECIRLSGMRMAEQPPAEDSVGAECHL